MEILNEAARRLELGIECVVEADYGSMMEGLRADRYDLLGTLVWPNSTGGTLADFSRFLGPTSTTVASLIVEPAVGGTKLPQIGLVTPPRSWRVRFALL